MHRPNFFLSARLTSPSLAIAVRAAQDGAIERCPALARHRIPTAELHLTLALLRLHGSGDVARAAEVLQQCGKPIVSALYAGVPPSLITLAGVDQFGGGHTVYAMPVADASLERLMELGSRLRAACEEHGLSDPSTRPFQPHVTLFKIKPPAASWGGGRGGHGWRGRGRGGGPRPWQRGGGGHAGWRGRGRGGGAASAAGSSFSLGDVGQHLAGHVGTGHDGYVNSDEIANDDLGEMSNITTQVVAVSSSSAAAVYAHPTPAYNPLSDGATAVATSAATAAGEFWVLEAAAATSSAVDAAAVEFHPPEGAAGAHLQPQDISTAAPHAEGSGGAAGRPHQGQQQQYQGGGGGGGGRGHHQHHRGGRGGGAHSYVAHPHPINSGAVAPTAEQQQQQPEELTCVPAAIIDSLRGAQLGGSIVTCVELSCMARKDPSDGYYQCHGRLSLLLA